MKSEILNPKFEILSVYVKTTVDKNPRQIQNTQN